MPLRNFLSRIAGLLSRANHPANIVAFSLHSFAAAFRRIRASSNSSSRRIFPGRREIGTCPRFYRVSGGKKETRFGVWEEENSWRKMGRLDPVSIPRIYERSRGEKFEGGGIEIHSILWKKFRIVVSFQGIGYRWKHACVSRLLKLVCKKCLDRVLLKESFSRDTEYERRITREE